MLKNTITSFILPWYDAKQLFESSSVKQKVDQGCAKKIRNLEYRFFFKTFRCYKKDDIYVFLLPIWISSFIIQALTSSVQCKHKAFVVFLAAMMTKFKYRCLFHSLGKLTVASSFFYFIYKLILFQGFDIRFPFFCCRIYVFFFFPIWK